MSIPNSPLPSALFFASMGWAVLSLPHPPSPGCSCGNADCDSVGKHPRTYSGVYDATTDLHAIERMWSRRPDANIGIATGAIVVIDVDGREALTAIRELENAHEELPPTPCVVTGN